MKKRGLFLAISWLVILVATLFHPPLGSCLHVGEDPAKTAQPQFASGRLIIKLKPEVDKKIVLNQVGEIMTTGLSELDDLHLRFTVRKQEKLMKEFQKTALKSDKFSSVYLLVVPEETDLKQMKVEYESLPEVEYVELDYKLELFESPDDPLFPDQWYLNNAGQGYLGMNRIPGDYNDTQVIKYGTEDADIDALEAFQRPDEMTTPLVGIIDTGVDLVHEDLRGHVWINPGEIPDNGVDDDHNGFVDDVSGWDFSGDTTEDLIEDNDPSDYFGHGTHCAGIVASVRGNALGVSGITSPCKIMAIKFFPNSFFSLGAKSIVYAADMGCDVINMSWGGPFPSRLIEDAIDYAVGKGVLPVAAAGNSGGEDSFYPASLPQVFTVGASNSEDEVTYFSTYGEHIDVVAPGEDILSLRADSTDMYATGGASGIEPDVHIVDEKYYLADGTSMASPCAAGVAAYILAASPGISSQRVRQIMEQSADDLLYPYGGDSLYSPGEDIYSGYGRVNLNSALELLSGRLAKVDYPYENAIVSGDVAILGTASGDSFKSYTLEYGEGYFPAAWIEIASSDLPVTKDTLGIWNSSGLAGRYTIRLTVGEENQALVHVVVSNDVYVKITSPSDGDTITGYAQIYGHTVVPDFSHYTLEYGREESPSEWDTITTSTKMGADDLLGNWLVSFLQETDYTLRLAVDANTGETYFDSVVVFIRSIASESWSQSLSGHGSLSPAVGDVDGDGYDEIVVGVGGPAGWGQTGGIEVFTHEGERQPGWPKDTSRNMMSSPALGDLDKDGKDDIVICSQLGGIHAYVSGSPDWTRSAGTHASLSWGLATPMMADLEGDGNLEVLMVNDEGTVYAWRSDGQSVIPGNYGVLAQTDLGGGAFGFPSLAVADLDGDGEKEIIVGSSSYYSGFHGGVYVLDVEGNLLLGPGDYPQVFDHIAGIAIANLDENDDLEIVVFGADTSYFTLSAYKKDGTQPPAYPIVVEDLFPGGWYGNHPAVGDLEGDGILEIVVSAWTPGEARIYAWHQDGTPLGSVGSDGLLVSMKSPYYQAQREILDSLGDNIEKIMANLRSMKREKLFPLGATLDQDPVFASVAETFGSPVLADVNQDGFADIVARAGYLLATGYERLFAWDCEGNLIPGFPLYASAVSSMVTDFPYSPVIADMDKDGKLDMVLATDWPYYSVIFWEFDSYIDSSTLYWPKYMHDKHNSGVLKIEDYSRYGISDIVYLINYLFRGGPAPEPIEWGDVNCDDDSDLRDVVYLINYLFRGGPVPC